MEITRTISPKEFQSVLIKNSWTKTDKKVSKKEQVCYTKADKLIAVKKNMIEAYKTGSNKTGVFEEYDSPRFILSSGIPYNEKDIEFTLNKIKESN